MSAVNWKGADTHARSHWPLLMRFFEKVDLSGGIGACWTWKAAKDPKGYGRFRAGDRTACAHRWLFEQVNGPTDAEALCHRCDNPSCVNPNHLWPGTLLENNADMVRKGRQCRGERRRESGLIHNIRGEAHCQAKLTAAAVLEMRAKRAEGRTFQSIADEYGVTHATAFNAITGKTWRSVR